MESLLSNCCSIDKIVRKKEVFHEKKMLGVNNLVICRSQAMQTLYGMIRRIAPTDYPVLITGATGVGKEAVASLIHDSGSFPDAPFIDVNCGGIPENLVESELFGHEKGAFTGSAGKHKGYFELVGKGSLFLDEVGELPLLQQVRLLRVLETRKFRPVGAENVLEFTGRVIAATNRDLQQLVKEGRFREDLYYRLNVFRLEVPPLRERLEDIPDLVNRFCERQRDCFSFSDEAMREMIDADWPGNIRQLKSFVDRVAVLCDENFVSVETVRYFLSKESRNDPDGLRSITEKIMALDLENKLTTIEYHVIQRALEESGGNKTAAAKAIGVHRKVIERRLRAFDADINEIYILCASGKKKMMFSQYEDALAQYENALGHVNKYAYSIKFDALKLEILLKQCVCLRNLYGWKNREVSEKYEKALHLGKRLYRIEKLAVVYFGIWAEHLMNLDLQKALDLARKYLGEGQGMKSPYLMAQAHIALANTKFWLGEFGAVRENLSAFIGLYEANSEMLIDHGHDPFVFYLMFSSLASFHGGDYETSEKTLFQLLRYAEEIRHPFSMAIALHAGAWIAFLLGRDKESYHYATRLVEDFSDNVFVFYVGIGLIFKGYHTAVQGRAAEGRILIQEGFRKTSKESGLLFHSMYAILLGRVYVLENRVEESFDVLEKAIHLAEEKHELCYLSDLFNARGKLYCLSGNKERAEMDFRKALEVAKELGSHPAEQQASMALSDLLSRSGVVHEGGKNQEICFL